MTTHENQTLSNSQDESQTAAAVPPPVSGHPEPVAPQEQNPSEPSPVPHSSTASGGSVPAADGPAEPAAKDSHTERESSTEELLFAEEELAELRARWTAVQAAFVDDPNECVQKADVLVSDLVEQLTSGFANARSRLEEQWARGEQASTEDLRVALMHYREFFERLLAA